MAATFAFRAPGEGQHSEKVPGAYLDALVEVTGDASYPAGGYSFLPVNLPGSAYSMIESVEVVNPWTTPTPTTFIAAWIKSTNKIAALTQAAAGAATPQAEITAGTSLAAFTCTLRVRFH